MELCKNSTVWWSIFPIVLSVRIEIIYIFAPLCTENPATYEKDCFHFFTCYLPDYTVKDVFGFCPEEVEQYMRVIRSTAHLILEFSRQGGFEHASGL